MAGNAWDSFGKRLVEVATGRISREIFVGEDVYREELEQVFTRKPAEHVPAPGGVHGGR